MTLDEDLGPEWSLLHGSFERVRLSAALPRSKKAKCGTAEKSCRFKASRYGQCSKFARRRVFPPAPEERNHVFCCLTMISDAVGDPAP